MATEQGSPHLLEDAALAFDVVLHGLKEIVEGDAWLDGAIHHLVDALSTFVELYFLVGGLPPEKDATVDVRAVPHDLAPRVEVHPAFGHRSIKRVAAKERGTPVAFRHDLSVRDLVATCLEHEFAG